MSSNLIYRMNRVSRLFQPINVVPKNSQPQHDFPSKSYKLMIDEGIIRQASSGMYNILPLGLRAVEKLSRLVDQEMTNIGAQKILLPHLTSRDLWETTGRVHVVGTELFTLLDRHDKEYILSPTHEEAVTNLISSVSPLSTKILPLRLYQISSKWRDEMKPRLGLLRGREFIMKDLYTFDKSTDDASETYKNVCQAYDHIFRKIGIKFRKVIGNSGSIGGSMSNEYHYISDIGEDKIVTCSTCNYSANTEVHTNSTCPECDENLIQNTAVEVGHTFLLGTKYSKPMHATFLSNGKPTPFFMGCYGLGLTRILATAIEILSTNEELRWPTVLAPYTVCIIPPKDGSKEAEAAKYANNMYKILEQSGLDIIIDDRTDLTIGKRLHRAKKTGYPFIVVIGRKAMQPNPQFEIYYTVGSKQLELNFEATVEYLHSMTSSQDTIHEMDQLFEESH